MVGATNSQNLYFKNIRNLVNKIWTPHLDIENLSIWRIYYYTCVLPGVIQTIYKTNNILIGVVAYKSGILSTSPCIFEMNYWNFVRRWLTWMRCVLSCSSFFLLLFYFFSFILFQIIITTIKPLACRHWSIVVFIMYIFLFFFLPLQRTHLSFSHHLHYR